MTKRFNAITLACTIVCAIATPVIAQTGSWGPTPVADKPVTPATAQAADAVPSVATPASVAASKEAPAEVLTLLQAYRLAVEQDGVIRTARAGADSRRERLPQARSQLLPNAAIQASANRNDLVRTQPGLSGPVTNEIFYDSSSRALIVRQPIFRPALWADYRQAKAQVADANATLDKETQNLATRVVSAYLEALLAEDQLALVLQQKQTYGTQVEAAKRRFSGGTGVRTDIDEATARYDLAVAHELEAKQNVEYTRRALQVIINRPVKVLAHVDVAKLRSASEPGTLETWRERAEITSPELISLRAQRDAARAEYDKATAGHLPTLDGVLQISQSKSDSVTNVDTRFNNKSIGLQLNIPVFSGGLTNSQIRAALSEIERTDEALEATRRDLGLRVEKEYRGVTEGVFAIRAYETAVRSAEVMVVSNQNSYKGGVRTVVDVLNAEEQRLIALRDLANSRYTYMISRVRLKALSGVADEQAIAEIDGWMKP